LPASIKFRCGVVNCCGNAPRAVARCGRLRAKELVILGGVAQW